MNKKEEKPSPKAPEGETPIAEKLPPPATSKLFNYKMMPEGPQPFPLSQVVDAKYLTSISPSGTFPSFTPTIPPTLAGPSSFGLADNPWLAGWDSSAWGSSARDARLRDLESRLTGSQLSFAQLQEELRKKVAEAEEKGQAHEKTLAENQQLFKELETEKSKVLKGKALRHLAEKVEEKAMELLEKDERFVKMLSGGTCSAFVLSIDLRKSTTLMLKARDPQLYAMFIRDLCDKLYSAVLANHGVFDKFTGDGVLAFFPDFYSGNDACYWAIKTASQCHAIFAEEYRKHRNCFASVLSDVGLGIGIDFGSVDLVSLWGGLTVVGAPVVYACRMGSAPAGTTLLNQPAYEKASEQYSAHCSFRETTVEVKGEGPTVAYDVELDKRPYDPALPDWPDLIAEREKSNPNSALRANFNGGVNREPQNLTNR